MTRTHIFTRLTGQLAVAVCMITLMAACSSSRKATKTGTDAEAGTVVLTQTDKLTTETVTKVDANRQTARGIRGKANVSIGSLSASGSIKMKRDEIIQVSLSALLGLMEVGRLELTPDYLYILDRINHEYVRARWEEVPQLQQAGINFFTFQGLFWEELFVPGKTQTPAIADFTTQQSPLGLTLEPRDQANGQYAMMVQFLVDAASGIIRQATVTSPRVPSLKLEWTYSAWTSLDGKSFPAEMVMSMASANGSNNVRFRLSGMQVDEQMGSIASPMPGSNYSPMDINRLFRRLMK